MVVEVTKRIYIRSRSPIKRLANLQKLADRYFHGNFSLLVNDALNRHYNLDPETGEPRPKGRGPGYR